MKNINKNGFYFNQKNVNFFGLVFLLLLLFAFWIGVSDLAAMGTFQDNPPPKSESPKSSTPVSETSQIVVPAGTRIKAQLNQSIRTSTHRTGQSFFATLKDPLVVGGQTVFPAGVPLFGLISTIRESGYFSGTALIELQLVRVMTSSEINYPLTSEPFQKIGRAHLLRNIGLIGGGAILGAGLGSVLGQVSGALIGIGLGGGTGTVLAYVTGKEELFLKAGTELVFKLARPLTVSFSSPPPIPLK